MVCHTFKMQHLLFFVHCFVPPKSLYFVFLSGAVFCKMVHCILQRGAQKYGAKILFIQPSGNESEGIPRC